MNQVLKNIRYSVVIPCYNDGYKIRRAVESCFRQTLKPFEVVVVDDHSQPETQTILQQLQSEYGKDGLKCIFLEKNSGVSVARNTGIENTCGEYICFLDGDDAWHPDKLSIVDELVKLCHPPGIGHAATYDLNDLNRMFKRKGPLPLRYFGFISVMLRNPLTTPSLVIASNLNLRFNEKMKYAEDHDLIVRLAKKEKIVFIDYPLVFIDRRIGSPGGLSGNRWKMRRGEMKMFVNLCSAYPSLYIILPFLILYSLFKHIRKISYEGVRS